jgi:hypothetical protein
VRTIGSASVLIRLIVRPESSAGLKANSEARLLDTHSVKSFC